MSSSLRPIAALCAALACAATGSGCSPPSQGGGAGAGRPGSSPAASQPASGIFAGSAGGVSVEVAIEGGRIAHVELVSFKGDSASERKAIDAIDAIEWKNSLDVAEDFPAKGDLIAAIRNALGEAGLSPEKLGPARREAPEERPPEQVNADIVVVGAGCAGLCAAIEAKDRGAGRVVILEKMSFAGGNTRMSNGCYGAPRNWLQKKAGINDDSPGRFFEDMDKGAYHTGNPELIAVLADGALGGALWLRDEIGMRFQDQLTWYEGHSRVRSLRAVGDGFRFVDTLLAAAEKRGIAVYYTTRANRLAKGPSGRVAWVEAERGGAKLRFRAAKGVVLATGGFGANIQMRQKYRGRWKSLDASVLTSNSPGSTGDGIAMAQDIGAALVDMQDIQLYPINNPATGNLYLLDYARLNDNAILLNREGRRFVNERATRDVIAAAVIAQPSGTVYELIDGTTAARMKLPELYRAEIERGREQGVIATGSLEKCALNFGLPLGEMRGSISRFNAMVAAGRDEDFGRDDLKAIDDGPYIMLACVVSVHHTMGGVKISAGARVLDGAGTPIRGLYAAGEVTGGIHGVNRLGSAALVDGVVFGRIAGRNAARDAGR